MRKTIGADLERIGSILEEDEGRQEKEVCSTNYLIRMS
jgi:hypothetical protein